MHAIDFDVKKLVGKTISDFTVTTNEKETEIMIKFEDGSGIGILGCLVTRETEAHRFEKDELYIRDV